MRASRTSVSHPLPIAHARKCTPPQNQDAVAMACLENAHRNGHWVRMPDRSLACVELTEKRPPPGLSPHTTTIKTRAHTHVHTGDPQQHPPHAALAPAARAEAGRVRAGTIFTSTRSASRALYASVDRPTHPTVGRRSMPYHAQPYNLTYHHITYRRGATPRCASS